MASENEAMPNLGEDTRKAMKRAKKAVKTRELVLNSLEIHTLPPLPPTLVELQFAQTDVSVIPPLPPHLEFLYCGYTPVTALPPLPNSLRTLWVNNTQITELPPLPLGLQDLYVGGFEGFTHLPPELPPTLTKLSLGTCPVEILPPLPPTLKELILYKMNIRILPELPASLQTLSLRGHEFVEPFQSIYNQYKVVYGQANNHHPELSYVSRQRMPAFRAAVNAIHARERQRVATSKASGRNLAALTGLAYGPPANNPFRALPNDVVRRMAITATGINAPLETQRGILKEAASRPLFAPGAGANFNAAEPLPNNAPPALEPATGGFHKRRTVKRKGYKARAQKTKKRAQRR